MPDWSFFVRLVRFINLKLGCEKQCAREKKKREKKKNVSSLQKASIGMLISCRNVEAAVLISPPIRWPIELDDRGRPLIGKLMTFRRQRINPYESRSSRFSVRSSSAWRPSPPTLSGDNLLISKQASVNFWYSCGSCVFKSSNVDFDGFFFLWDWRKIVLIFDMIIYI